MLNMWYELTSSSYRRDFILSITISGNLKIFYTGFNSLLYQYIYCIWLNKLILLCPCGSGEQCDPRGIFFSVEKCCSWCCIFLCFFGEIVIFFFGRGKKKEMNLGKQTIDDFKDGWYLRSKLIKSSHKHLIGYLADLLGRNLSK